MIPKADVVKRIRGAGVIPVIRTATADEAIAAAQAIRAGGLPILEITLTVPGACEVIRHLAHVLDSDTIVGAGTVLDPDNAGACITAGARFVVSPVLNVELVERCRRQDVAVIPGALTPAEIVRAWEAGADFVKVFPASALGGASYVRALKAALPHVELVPTGGVTLENAAAFIEAGAAAVGVGSDLVDLHAIRAGQPGKVAESARAFIDVVRAARRRSNLGTDH